MEKGDEREIVNEFLRSAILKTRYERKARGLWKAPEGVQKEKNHNFCITLLHLGTNGMGKSCCY